MTFKKRKLFCILLCAVLLVLSASCPGGGGTNDGSAPSDTKKPAKTEKDIKITQTAAKSAETENSYDLRTASRRNLRAFKMVFTARLMSSSVSVRSSERSSKLNAMLFLPSGMPLSPASLG